MSEDKKVEVLPPEEEKQETAIVKRSQHDVDIGITVRPSRLPWVNRFTRKNLESFTEVIKAKTGLMDAMADHAKTKDRLTDIETEIEADRIDRRNRLAGAKRTAKLTGKEDQLAELDLDLQITEKEKRLAELRQTPKEEKKKTDEEQQAEKLAKLKKQQQFKAQERAVRIFGEFYTRKEIERECERLKREIIKDRPENELSQAEQEALEDVEDAKNFALERL